MSPAQLEQQLWAGFEQEKTFPSLQLDPLHFPHSELHHSSLQANAMLHFLSNLYCCVLLQEERRVSNLNAAKRMAALNMEISWEDLRNKRRLMALYFALLKLHKWQ